MQGVSDLAESRPEIAKEDFLAVLVPGERVAGKINVHSARQRKRDNQRRRHQKIRFDVLVHPRFKIPIPRKNRSRNQVIFVNGLLDVWMQRPRVADASRATISDEIEPELVEIFLQAGFRQIIGNHARTRRERCFYCRVNAKSALDRSFRKQASRDHDARIAGVGATCDRCDQNAAVADMTASAHENFARLRFNLFRGIRRWPVCNHLEHVAFFAGCDPLVFLCISRSHRAVARGTAVQFHDMSFPKIDILFSVSAVAHRLLEQFAKCFSKLRQVDPVLRAFRSGDARLYVCQIQIHIDAVIDLAPKWHSEHFLCAKIIFEHKTLFFATSRGPQVIHRFSVNWKISHRRAVFGRHVPNRRAVRHRQ